MVVDKENYNIEDLLEIVKILRSPEGCPWDSAQNHKSIRNNLIEEAYEVVEAIDNDDTLLLREELGDLLLQVVMNAQFEAEQDSFSFDDVCSDICKKLIFRHPHVFGDSKATNASEALASWEDMKKLEKNQITKSDTLSSVAKSLPALMYAQKVQKRAAKAGMDHISLEDAFNHLALEQQELWAAIVGGDKNNIYEELGEVIFSVVSVARFLNVESEECLYDSSAKFVGRFHLVEKLANKRGIDVSQADQNILDDLWEEEKIDKFFGGIS